MAYSKHEDLLIGDMLLGEIDRQRYVDMAAREMDAELGTVYELPIDLGEVATHSILLLEKINNCIATGRLIEAQAAASQNMELNAYAERLLREGYADLRMILSGNKRLEGAPVKASSYRPTAPVLTNYDEESAVDVFEQFIRGESVMWRPGEA